MQIVEYEIDGKIYAVSSLQARVIQRRRTAGDDKSAEALIKRTAVGVREKEGEYAAPPPPPEPGFSAGPSLQVPRDPEAEAKDEI